MIIVKNLQEIDAILEEEFQEFRADAEAVEKKKILTKKEAARLLREHGITRSEEQMVGIWLKQNMLEGFKVTGGPVEERGMYVIAESLYDFIEYKTLGFADFVKMKNDYMSLKNMCKRLKIIRQDA